MSALDRAAQFSSFDALSGYSDMVKEDQRSTDTQIRLSDPAREKLDQKLSVIARAVSEGQNPAVTITHFVPDRRKTGGKYVETTEEIKKIDPVGRMIVLTKTAGRGRVNQTIRFDDVIDIRGELIDFIDSQPF